MGRVIFVAAVLVVAIAFDLHYAVPNAIRDAGIDFRVFWQAAARPLDQVYQPGQMPFVYPPTALLVFKPLSLASQQAGLLAWTLLSAVAFGLAVAWLAGWKIAALSFFSPAAVKGLILGQSAMLIGAAIFFSLALPPLAAGILLGALMTLKPQLLLLAPLAFAVRGEWKVLLGMAVGGAAMLLAAVAAFGIEPWIDWVHSLAPYQSVLLGDGLLDRMITPAARAQFVGLPQWPFILSGFMLGGAAIVAAARKLEGAGLIALIVAASLLTAPYAHVHDTIALIPACVILILRGPWWAALLAAVAFSGAPGLTMLAMMIGLIALTLKSIIDDRRLAPAA